MFDPPTPAASDVRLRAEADHQRIRNRVRGIGRGDHGDVNDSRLPAVLGSGVLPVSLFT